MASPGTLYEHAAAAEMRRVLYISFTYPPMNAGGVLRAQQFAKYLPEFGWAPTVLTAGANLQSECSTNGQPSGVRVLRSFCPRPLIRSRGAAAGGAMVDGVVRRAMHQCVRFVAVPDRYIVWWPSAVRAAIALLKREKFDVILSSYGPATSLLVGASVATKCRLPLVVDFRDLYSTHPADVFPTRGHRAVARRIERAVVRSAKRVIAVSEPMVDTLKSFHGRPRNDFSAIPNGFDPDDLQFVRDERTPHRMPFRIVHAGTTYSGDWEAFLQAISQITQDNGNSRNQLLVEFLGAAPHVQIDRWGIRPWVRHEHFVPHDQVFSTFARADVLLLNERTGYCDKYGYPVKLFDYLLTGKPILAIVNPDGNAGRLVQQMENSAVVHPQDVAGIRHALSRLMGSPRRTPTLTPIHVAPWCDFNRRHLARRLARTLSEACQSPNAQRRKTSGLA